MDTIKAVSEDSALEGAMTPSDLYRKEFKRTFFGGYDMREVDAFIERIGDSLKALHGQVRDVRGELETVRARLEEYRQMETTLRSALVSSQRMGEGFVASARQEADVVREATRVEKERVLLEASKLPAALASEIQQLQEQRDRLRHEMLAILSTHRVFLDSLTPAEEQLGGRVFVTAVPEVTPADETPPVLEPGPEMPEIEAAAFFVPPASIEPASAEETQ